METDFDVFISHSSKDKVLAGEICSYLEKNKIKCWIAPRNVRAGYTYGSEIVEGIKSSRVVILVFSGNSNQSKPVANEVDIAYTNEKHIIPYRIDDVLLGSNFVFYLSNVHWIDASKNPKSKFEDLLIQIRKYTKPPVDESVKKALQISDEILKLHNKGLVHGCLSPDSIIETGDGKIQVNLDNRIDTDSLKTSKVRKCLSFLPFSSPESLENKSVDIRSDVFSFGAIFYEMLTNEKLIKEGTRTEIKRQMKSINLSKHDSIIKELPVEIQKIVLKCLEKDPSSRYQNFDEISRDLKNAIHVMPIPPPPPPPHGWLKYAIIAGIAAFISIVILILGRTSNKDVVKDLIVINDFNVKNIAANEDPARLSSSMLIYLITENVLQASDKNLITSDEFSIMYGKDRMPELSISGELVVRNIGYSINVLLKSPTGKTKKIVRDFADPEDLLNTTDGAIRFITDNIIKNIDGKISKKPSSFTNSWDAFKLFFDGEKAWQKLDVTRAEKDFKVALTYDNDFVLAKLRYAQVLVFNDYDLEARRIISEIKPKTGMLSQLDSLRTLAMEARLSGEFFEENNILKKIFNLYPTRKECAYDVAESYFEKCDVENAILYYKKALDLDKYFALAHNHIAYCYSHIGDHAMALKHFEIYLSLDSTANSYDSYGDGLMAAGRLDSAERIKERGIILDSALYYIRGTLGYIHLRQGKFDIADQDFQQYINLTTDRKTKANGYFRKALIPYYRGDYNDALKICLSAENLYDTIDITARDHELHWLLGILYLKLNKPARAQAELSIMRTLAEQNNISATNYKLDFYKYLLHLDIAIKAYNSELPGMLSLIEEFDTSIKNKVKDHTSEFDLAFFNTSFGELMLLNQINRTDLAEKRFRKALEYNPNYALAHYNLWRLFQLKGQSDSANVHHEKLHKIWNGADLVVNQAYGVL